MKREYSDGTTRNKRDCTTPLERRCTYAFDSRNAKEVEALKADNRKLREQLEAFDSPQAHAAKA